MQPSESSSLERKVASWSQVCVAGENGAYMNLWQRSDGQEPFAEILQEGGFFVLYTRRKVRILRKGRFTTLREAQDAVT